MNILIIFTGGTIGSVVKENYISTDSAAEYTLISNFRRISDIDVNFTTVSPYTLLSENLSGKYINELISCVNSHQSEDYDGIIITHGTDTLQYTAAALGISFPSPRLPIVMISSNYVLEDSRSNGMDNLISAIHFIGQCHDKGIFVAYRNETASASSDGSIYTDKLNYIYDAVTLLPHNSYSDMLYAIDNSYYGIVKDSHFIKNRNYIKAAPMEVPAGCTRFSDISPVLYIKPVPGQLYPLIPQSTKAVLLDSYHSGTLNTLGDELKAFVKEAHNKNIPVYLTGVENRTQYESTKEYDSLGITILPKLSPVTSYMLLWLSYS